jgi:rare lipoprotein A
MRKLSFAGGLVVLLCIAGLRLLGEVTAPVAQPQEEAIQLLSPSPSVEPAEVIMGKASWYGPGFHGRPTSSGVPYNRYALTAAHRTLRPGTVVRVTNLRNQRSAVLVINDWGPVPEDREIDVSEAAAEVLGFRERGLARVRIEVYRAANNPL